jgi:iron complex outermembrane receptor protein
MKNTTERQLALATAIILGTGAAQAAVLEEVIVTAQKREQSAQELPMSVTAISGDTMTKLGISDSQELVQHTVNVTNNAALGEGSRPAYYVRGIGLMDFNSNNTGPVGVYRDEVYLSNMTTQMVPLFDIDRIEVLRGPQGTLFGRNTSAGALSFFSTTPSQETEGYVTAKLGDHGLSRFEGAVGGGLTENLSGRISALKLDSDGHIDNKSGSGMEGARDILAWRAQLGWQASDAVDVLFNIHGGKDKSEPSGYGHWGQTTDGATPCEPSAISANQCVDALGFRNDYSDFYAIDSDVNKRNDTDTLGGVVKVNWSIGDITLTSVTGYDDADQLLWEDADASPNNLAHTSYGTDVDTFSQELRAVGSTDNSNWIVGVYYMTEDMAIKQTAELLGLFSGFSLDDLTGILGDADTAQFIFDNVVFTSHFADQDTDSYAVFGQVEYSLTDDLTATVGLRWTREERDFEYTTNYDMTNYGPIVPAFTLSDDFDDDDISGRLAVDYTLNDDVRVYASISQGFKAGGFNGGFLFTPPPKISYDSETVLAYEIGLKGDFLENTLRLNMAAFYYDYSDMQVFTFINTGGLPTQVLDNASDAEIYGVELEADWQATERLGFFLGLGLLDTELKDFQSVGEDYSGNQLPLAPEFNAVGMAFYDIPLDSGASVSLQLDFSYDDDVFFLPSNNPVFEQEGYGLVNARATFTSSNDQWEIAAWGKNLTGEEYYSAMFDFSDFGLVELMQGADTSYGIEATFRF